eukprot:TRINITY_DN1463_c0_g1_i6.p1 TRINITY_DN1463_c0_g1~~TRINITY_DN1463_c0_g1_i6.p1  ORF type:complete len:573 (+),score=111.19 TRINITY_DN1463_c0_g1_i6:101-1819(+)
MATPGTIAVLPLKPILEAGANYYATFYEHLKLPVNYAVQYMLTTGETKSLKPESWDDMVANGVFVMYVRPEETASPVPDFSVDEEEPEEHSYDFDLIVIGGGSGGLSAAKQAALCGKTVALFDFVKPSPQGTTWGLGGTCVNVGCIPKKLMHHSAIIGEKIHDSTFYGWNVAEKKHDWATLVQNVQDHIGSLNFGYVVELREATVKYINAYAQFTGPHSVEATDRKGKKTTYTARRFIIAVGGRPNSLEVPGGEHAITSDDIFSLDRAPGKTLVVGAAYIALECAGFLTGLGYDTSVMARSIFLRGFDQEVAEMIVNAMSDRGTKFLRECVPTRIEQQEDGKLKVFWQSKSGEESDIFDTVLSAIGRRPVTDIGLETAGVHYNKQSGKISAVNERTNIPHIYAIGDVLEGRPELTPVAIKAGKLLAKRLYDGSKELMDYDNIPTVVFTPMEYGCIGLSEEAAIARFGAENIEVYHTYFKPLEGKIVHEEIDNPNPCYVKLIVDVTTNERVIGFHILSHEAGEITQGIAVAMKAGACKSHFDAAIGIHPTMAEEFTILKVTKSSGQDPRRKGC